jgi:hypothetical protein
MPLDGRLAQHRNNAQATGRKGVRMASDDPGSQATELLEMSIGADGTVVGIAPSGAVLQWNAADQTWSKIGGAWPSLAHLSVRNSEELWGLDSAGVVHRASLAARPCMRRRGKARRADSGTPRGRTAHSRESFRTYCVACGRSSEGISAPVRPGRR